MYKKILFFGLLLMAMKTYGQVTKGDLVISFTGNYSQNFSESGVTSDFYTTRGKYLETGMNGGKFISNHIIFGIGLDYLWGKELRTHETEFYQTGKQVLTKEYLDVTSNLWMPSAFIGYYYPILNRFYFNMNVKFAYGTIKSDYESIYAKMTNYTSDSVMVLPNDDFSLSTSVKNASSDYFTVRVSPELTYFLASKFGISLGLGGIEYALTDWDTETSSFSFNFNPGHWKFGIRFRFGKDEIKH
jgi:hypothetical protein